MRDLLRDYYDGRLSRRGFLGRLVATGLTAAAARSVVDAADLGTAPAAPAGGARTFSGTGGELLVEQIAAAGSRYIFTNPGSLEVGFFDALTDHPELQVVVGLHEGIVVAMADAYHKVSRQPAFVNVHAAVGTAQMAGQMYNAHFDGSALVVTAGMNDTTINSDEAVLAPRPGFTQAEINRQFTKISWEVRNAGSTALALRRAYKIAATAPGGPVYIAYATRALTEPASGEVWPRQAFLVSARPRPAADQIDALARMLVEAKRPLVMLGDEIWRADATVDALALCELLGAPMMTPGLPGFQYVSAMHPQYLGTRAGGDRAYPYGGADLVVQLGTRDPGSGAIPDRATDDARFAAVGLDTNMLGRTHALDLAVVGDVKAAIRDLTDAVHALATAERLAKIREERLAVVRPAIASANAARLDAAKKTFGRTPIHPDELGWAMEQALEPNALVLVENQPGVAGKHDFLRIGPRPEDKQIVSHGGGSLGWGLGAAVGAKLAAPDRQVVLSVGDGSLMYSAAGFWSMARHSAAVLTIVWNNRNYQTVRSAGFRYSRRMAATGHYHGLYLGDPDVDFVKLAESQGVSGQRVTTPAELVPAIKRGVQETRGGNPYVIEVVVARVGGGADSTWYQKVKPGGAGAVTTGA